MERISRLRATILLLLFALVIGFFVYTMYDLQIVETGGVIDNTTTFTTITRVKAARGDILDRNGNKLVGNRASYDLMLNHYVLLSANGTNQHIMELIETCEEQGIPYTDHFPVSAQKPFVYTLEQYSTTWQSYFQTFLDYQGNLDSDITAPLLIEKLREIYNIPEELSENEARKIIGLRYEMSLRNCVPSMSTYVFMEDADDETLSTIVELNIPGLTVEASTVREYYTTYAAHVLGHVGAMNAEQWEYYQHIPGYEMDTMIGQSGLEQAYEEYLHGTDGWREDTVAADGTLISSRYLTEPKAGSNVEVSIDTTLQMVAETQLAAVINDLRALPEGEDGQDAQGGCAVVIDVKTGQILVCANYPSYDPADYFEKYDELLEAEYNPLINRALQSAYPPGSTYKMVTSIAALENGFLTPTSEIEDKGVFTKYSDSGLTLSCMAYRYGRTHGSINVANALMYSCNYFYYYLGDIMKIETLDPVAKALGLGEPTGVELTENIGYRSNPETKKELYSGSEREWVQGDMLTTVIGQSDNRFTTMQLGVYVATLANGGVRNKATFMNRVVSADYQELLAENTPKVLSTLEMQQSTIDAYFEGMRLVVASPNGTAYFGYGHEDLPYTAAGKTGTAEHMNGASDHGSFVCFSPHDKPEIAIAIYIERGGHGATLTSIARAIMNEYFKDDTVSDVITYENKLS